MVSVILLLDYSASFIKRKICFKYVCYLYFNSDLSANDMKIWACREKKNIYGPLVLFKKKMFYSYKKMYKVFLLHH